MVFARGFARFVETKPLYSEVLNNMFSSKLYMHSRITDFSPGEKLEQKLAQANETTYTRRIQ